MSNILDISVLEMQLNSIDWEFFNPILIDKSAILIVSSAVFRILDF